MIKHYLPHEIEQKSFSIITEEIEKLGVTLPEVNANIIKRVIHTSADFSYIDNLVFSDNVVKNTLDILKYGCTIVTDTNMAKAGINKAACEKLNIKVECFIADSDVFAASKSNGTTRAFESIKKCTQIKGNLIFAIGNAPTALIAINELISKNELAPNLIIGVPVGFVNVVESKELILNLKDTPYIVAKGRKGGSNVSASIVNALLYEIGGRS